MSPQTRLDEKEAAERRATTSASEAAELSKRLVELKMGEIERMNEARPPPNLSVACMRQAALGTHNTPYSYASPFTHWGSWGMMPVLQAAGSGKGEGAHENRSNVTALAAVLRDLPRNIMQQYDVASEFGHT